MLRCGDWSAAVARVHPKAQWRMHMLHNLRRRTMTVPMRIFEKFTELMVRQALQIIGIAGDGRCNRAPPEACASREIVILMTGAASDSIYALPVWSTADLHRVTMTIVS